MPDHAGRLLLGVAAIAALVGAAYVTAREFAGGRTATPVEASAHVVQPPAIDPMTLVGAAPAALPAPPTLPELTSSPPVRPSARPATPVRTASLPAYSLSNPNEARAPEPPVAAAAQYPPLDSFGPLAEAPKPPPPPVVVARAAPPTPDRWQMMSDALSRCASEGDSSGFICDQRVRLASCDGYWGRVAQCPTMPENPR
jgi:hypothetical protein